MSFVVKVTAWARINVLVQLQDFTVIPWTVCCPRSLVNSFGGDMIVFPNIDRNLHRPLTSTLHTYILCICNCLIENRLEQTGRTFSAALLRVNVKNWLGKYVLKLNSAHAVWTVSFFFSASQDEFELPPTALLIVTICSKLRIPHWTRLFDVSAHAS